MKLFLHECPNLPDTEVEIRYRKKDCEVEQLISVISSSIDVVFGINTNGDTEKISLSQIFYIEAVDRGVWVYKSKEVYKIKKTLYELEEELKNRFFVRISKNTIVNINAIKSVAPEDSRRIKLLLKNGEYLIVSRNYVNDFKFAIGMKEGK